MYKQCSIIIVIVVTSTIKFNAIQPHNRDLCFHCCNHTRNTIKENQYTKDDLEKKNV